MAKRGGSSTSEKGGAAAKAVANKTTVKEKKLFSQFDSASTEEKIQILKENDSYGQEAIWEHMASQGTDVEYRDTTKKGAYMYLPQTKSFMKTTGVADQNDSVGIKRTGRISVYQDNKGNYYAVKLREVTVPKGTGYGNSDWKIEREYVKKLPWK